LNGALPRCGCHRSSGTLELLLVALVLAWPATAQEAEVLLPADLQARILLNVLTFDRNLAERAGEELVFAVLIQRRYIPSVEAGDGLLAALQSSSHEVMPGMRLRAVRLELDAGDRLDPALASLRPAVLYVPPLRALRIEDIVSSTRALKIRTVTGVADYVTRGLSVGLRLRDDRPEIVINLSAAIAEGADLNSQLLKLARVIR
jgi:YfiR/HmsC-like